MKVAQLISMLRELPQDANVHLDDEYYPSVDGVFSPEDYEGDEAPANVVLIEYSRNEPSQS